MKTINSKPFADFGAVFVSFPYTFPHIETNLLRLGMSHIDMGCEIMPKEMSLRLAFEKESGISLFLLEFINGAILDVEDGYMYDCRYLSSEAVHLGCNKYDVTFTLSAIKKKPQVTVTRTETDIEGDYMTDAVYEITAKSDVENVTVDNMLINKISKGDTFVIDGIDKLVYCMSNKGVSAFDDTNLTTFPKLSPGTHIVSCSSNLVSVVIKYYPIYL